MISYQKFIFNQRTEDGTGIYYAEGTCLSTDEKPTEGMANGSRLIEMDTSKLYLFDADNETWREWQ